MSASARLLSLALQHGERIPEPSARAAATLAAQVVPSSRLTQLRTNLSRVRPDLDARALHDLTRENLRRYLRYYAEMITLGALTPRQIQARLIVRGWEHIAGPTSAGRPVVAALGHLGNWDLAGAYVATREVGVLSVAEHLEPEEVFAGFLRTRANLGIRIVPLEGDGSTLRTLLREGRRGRPSLIPLLADRDLSGSGVPVTFFGERARMAPGPAALARMLGAPLLAIALSHVPLTGPRRRAAGSRWGIEARVVPVPTTGDIAADTQAWVDLLSEAIAARPADWHMMQPLWDADLPPRGGPR